MNDILTYSMPVFRKLKTEGATKSSLYTIVNGKYINNLKDNCTDRIDLEDEYFQDFSFILDQELRSNSIVNIYGYLENKISSKSLILSIESNHKGGVALNKSYLWDIEKIDNLTCNVNTVLTSLNSEVQEMVQNTLHFKGLEEIRNMSKVNHFIKSLIAYQEKGEMKMATKIIFTEVGNFLSKGNFVQLANFLSSIPFNKLIGKSQVAFLSVTNPWKNEANLKSVRDNLVLITEERLTEEVGKQRTEYILKSLK